MITNESLGVREPHGQNGKSAGGRRDGRRKTLTRYLHTTLWRPCLNIMTSAGVTQAIRSRLNFNDESKWKRFSARRLELIDELQLSTRKASEQDDQIADVARTLRAEYGYPEDFQNDFDKLVRAGIQSVRRNRKRVPKSKQPKHHLHTPPPSNVHVSGGASTPDKLSISSLVTLSPPNSNSSLSGNFASLSLNNSRNSPSTGSNELFISSLKQLSTFLHRINNNLAMASSNSNVEFLGESIINTAASLSVEKKNNATLSIAVSYIRSTLLSSIVLNALVDSIGVSSLVAFKTLLANCCISFGFDQTINILSSVFYELLSLDQWSQLTSPAMLAEQFPKFTPTAVKTVILHFLDQKLNFTYDPTANTPPTMSELIENGKNAFHIIGDNKVIKIRNLNANPNASDSIMETDNDIVELFSRSTSINFELFIPFTNQQQQQQPTNSTDTNDSRLPSISNVQDPGKPRFQQLL